LPTSFAVERLFDIEGTSANSHIAGAMACIALVVFVVVALYTIYQQEIIKEVRYRKLLRQHKQLSRYLLHQQFQAVVPLAIHC
jgi:hypothetical protein